MTHLITNNKNLSHENQCKILFLEDSANDVELMRHELKKSGLNFISKQVASKKEFLDALHKFKPDIILADYSLPMFNGMHAFKLFQEQNLVIPFILVTGYLSEQLSRECINEGVDDFVLKSNYKRLALHIERNMQRKETERELHLIQTELQNKEEELRLLKEKNGIKTKEILSKREFEILCFIALGRTSKEIADELFLSPATVATYRSRVLEKLDLKSNVELARYAIENNLLK